MGFELELHLEGEDESVVRKKLRVRKDSRIAGGRPSRLEEAW